MRIAVLGNSTLVWLSQELGKLLLTEGMEASFHTTEYEQYFQALLDPESDLHRFAPEAAILVFHTETLLPELLDVSWLLGPTEDREARLKSLLEDISGWTDLLRERHGCVVLVHNLVPPINPVLGLADAETPLGAIEFVERFNLELRCTLRPKPDIHLIDQVQCLRRVGEALAVDPKLRYLAGLEYSRPLLKQMAQAEARVLLARSRSAKKALVFDLDNTLWGGVLSEDGIEGLEIGTSGVGRAYQDLHRLALSLYDRGVLLCIASKNDEDEALRAIENIPGGILRKQHFATWEINWENKADNISKMAESLNLGLNAFVYLDDNPAERELVRQRLPEVEILNFPEDTARLPMLLAEYRGFDSLTVTEEDRKRTDMYRSQAARNQARTQFEDMDSFLASLEMELSIWCAEKKDVPRVGQLIRKTNQFNMTTIRRTDDEVVELMESSDYDVYCVGLKDRYGDQGLVGVVITQIVENEIIIETFLLSCRVLERKIENAIVAELIKKARERGANIIRAQWKKTAKNGRYRLAYEKAGLEVEHDEPDLVLFRKRLDDSMESPIPDLRFNFSYERRSHA